VNVANTTRITRPCFVRVLSDAQSPVLGTGTHCYSACQIAHIDPAFALAALAVLSKYGTDETARITRNWGLMQDAHYPDRATGRDTARDIAIYPNWLTALNDWIEYMRHRWRTRMHLDVIAVEYAPIASRPGAADRMRDLMQQWEQMEC
jgi:hypothetical protein